MFPERIPDDLARDGYGVLSGVYSARDVQSLLDELTPALDGSQREGEALRGRSEGLYGARNVLTLWPPAAAVWRRPPLPEVLAAVLGPGFGLVRCLFFDKPPGQSWALPWHKDLTIAVRDNRLPSAAFCKPTTKAGVPHVEAPCSVLETMLTARIHLDAMTEDNGPLRVIPGSHRSGKAMDAGTVPPRSILTAAGDVLLMRPLLGHASGHSQPEVGRHRRVLHLEFAAHRDLPDGFAWHTFIASAVS